MCTIYAERCHGNNRQQQIRGNMSHQFIKNMKTGVLRMERSSEEVHMPITLDFHFELAEEHKGSEEK